jgi:hypothetical protein
VIALQTLVTQLLLNVPSLGSARDALLNLSLAQLIPAGHAFDIRFASSTAVIVILAWAVVPAAIGAWRCKTQDA